MAMYEKPDFWSLRAQKEDYPARSIYKLKEIDEKFHFFKFTNFPKTEVLENPQFTDSSKTKVLDNPHSLKVFRVLDLGAAPGSWSLYVLRNYEKNGKKGGLFLAAVDLNPLSRHFEQTREEFLFIKGDFTAAAVREEIIRHGLYNVIMSDAAPPTTGSRTVDTMRSLALAEEVYSLAESCLVTGGSLVLKVFQGGDTASLLKKMRECFTNARSIKPNASRSNSFETYYIGLGKKL